MLAALTSFWIVNLLVGAFYLGIGVRIVIMKRPLIISEYKFFRYVWLILLLQIIAALLLGPHRPNLIAGLILITILVIFLAMIWGQEKYTVFGVEAQDYNKSLIAVLHKLNIPFKEDGTEIRIPSKNIKLESKGSPLGIIVRINDKSQAAWLKQLMSALEQYYESTPVKVTLASGINAGLFAIAMTAWAVVIFMSH